MEEDALFGNVGGIDGELALIENVTDRSVHPTFGSKTNPRFFTHLAKPSAAFVEIQLGDAVIVGNEQVWVAGAA